MQPEDLTVDIKETIYGIRYTFASPVDSIKALLFRSGDNHMILIDRGGALPLKEFLSVKYMQEIDEKNVKVTTTYGHSFEYENCSIETLIYIMKVLSDTMPAEKDSNSEDETSDEDEDEST